MPERSRLGAYEFPDVFWRSIHRLRHSQRNRAKPVVSQCRFHALKHRALVEPMQSANVLQHDLLRVLDAAVTLGTQAIAQIVQLRRQRNTPL